MASNTVSATASATSTATCVTVSPGKNGYLPPESCDVILYYVPSFGAAILFCVLFGLVSLLHTVQAIVYKKRYAWVLIMGAVWELLAFIFRALQTRHQDSEIYSTLHVIFFLLAPIWINAFIYMTLGRMIYFFVPERKLAGISARHYGMVFVVLDIVAFLVQLGGASLTTNTDAETKTVMLGLHIYMGGIGMQEFFILWFLGLAIYLHWKMVQMEAGGQIGMEKLQTGRFSWRWLFYSIYFALGMITVRIIFRLAQYAQGTSASNPVLTHEEYEYVFDAAPMFLGIIALNVFHPGHILRGPDSTFPRLTRAEKKEAKAQKKAIKMEKKQRRKGSQGELVPESSMEERLGSSARFYQV
ncbi:unnamed protein product [Penicillium salamii]|uniref:RTA-like protein n=1 Tax=Penicillium salamii TaxID=1612424 RepID=A0A9W4JUT1_9EURO|nr:unnamed protein product [Penicillium salamii]CAG8024888.1 unnamed protein product [Penicillium salamii]CAG8061298.1 unnamed protein product [Penicillium salamii]CAG8221040.1 unnamed protein product [Penicillium salamii]CAG8253774.1 unnamed protein product [Penicillium salamii]